MKGGQAWERGRRKTGGENIRRRGKEWDEEEKERHGERTAFKKKIEVVSAIVMSAHSPLAPMAFVLYSITVNTSTPPPDRLNDTSVCVCVCVCVRCVCVCGAVCVACVCVLGKVGGRLRDNSGEGCKVLSGLLVNWHRLRSLPSGVFRAPWKRANRSPSDTNTHQQQRRQAGRQACTHHLYSSCLVKLRSHS